MEKPGFPTPPPAGGCGRAQPASRDAGKPGFPITSPHGRAQPTSRGRGETRFPHAPARGRVREGCALPGTTVYSFPFVYGGAAWTTGGRTAWFRGRHISRPCGSAAQRRNEHKVILGRATPSRTLPRAGAWGNPGSSLLCLRPGARKVRPEKLVIRTGSQSLNYQVVVV